MTKYLLRYLSRSDIYKKLSSLQTSSRPACLPAGRGGQASL